SEELLRGYPAHENLFSAGSLSIELPHQDRAEWHISTRLPLLDPFKPQMRHKAKPKVLDFVLQDPPGIVAGYQWFGEWGRDTFISLPGMIAGKLKAKEDPHSIRTWAFSLMKIWGQWIEHSGMLPNFLGKDGEAH